MSEITNLVDQMIVDSLGEVKNVKIGTQDSDYMLKDVKQLIMFKMELEKMDLSREELKSKIKNDEENLKIRREELKEKIKNDEETLKLKKEELNQKKSMEADKIKLQKEELDQRKSNDEFTLKMRKEELDQKRESDEARIEIQKEEIAYKKEADAKTIELKMNELDQKRENDEKRIKLERLRSLREQLEKEVYSKNQNRNEIMRTTVELIKTLIVCVGTSKVASGVLAVEEAGVVRSKAFPLIGNLLGRIR